MPHFAKNVVVGFGRLGGRCVGIVANQPAGNYPYIAEKGTKVITNAGGMNVKACVEKAKEAIREGGYHLKVGYVLGDDVREIIPQLRQQGITMKHMLLVSVMPSLPLLLRKRARTS